MFKGLALAGCAAVTAPALYLMWSSMRRNVARSEEIAEEKLDDTIDQSFPASDPPAHRTVTSAG